VVSAGIIEVDFNNDGKIDLSGSTTDSIGSVANYLIAHGWEIDGPVASRAQVKDNTRHETLEMGLMPLHTMKKMEEWKQDLEVKHTVEY